MKELKEQMQVVVPLNNNKNNKMENTADVCFLLDTTGSMSQLIELCKSKITEIVDLLRKIYSSSIKLRLSFLGYKDIQDKPRFQVIDFTEDPFQIRTYLQQQVTASGGGDIPEDLTGGLEELKKLNWKSKKRLCVIITDAPCHGNWYHETSDNHRNGDPNGFDPEILLSELSFLFDVHFYFMKLNNTTDMMINLWRDHLEQHSGGQYTIRVYDFVENQSYDNFVFEICDSIASQFCA